MTRTRISCFLRVMTRWFFVILSLSLLWTPVWAASVNGFLLVEKDQYFFQSTRKSPRMLIRATKMETLESLKKLKDLDYFQGQGEIVKGELLLETIDFVGLRRLLGLWGSKTRAVLDFQNYNQVLVYRSFQNLMTPRALLQYTVAPSSGDDWKVFFTDENSVAIASLTLNGQQATLRFFDPSAGQVIRTIELSRMRIR